MIIGFLGKGGSGKTTLATMYIKYILSLKLDGSESYPHVLALDNDHNMDLKFNLGYEGDMNWMGRSLEDVFSKIAINSTKDIVNVEEEYIFSLNPIDDVTEKYSKEIILTGTQKKLRLMVAGPHTESMMYGNMCSHGLTTPLKVYLPLLKLGVDEFVIVDEKAGTDGVGTGVTTGFNLAVVVAEATTHGVKAAKQIIEMLKFYKTPFVVIVNKIRNNDEANTYDEEFTRMGAIKIFHFSLDLSCADLKLTDDYISEFQKLHSAVIAVHDDRIKRTKDRVRSQNEYNRNSS